MANTCIKGLSCGSTCISMDDKCSSTGAQLNQSFLAKAVSFIAKFFKDHKQEILTGIPVAAANAIGTAIAGPAAGAAASAATKVALSIGKKAYDAATSDKVKEAMTNGEPLARIARDAGAKFITDLKDEKFRDRLTKKWVEELAIKAISAPINLISPVRMATNTVATKLVGLAVEQHSKAMAKPKTA